MQTITWITAHAGAENTNPNTLESIRELIPLGVDCIEVDVRTRDGELLLSHDPLEDAKSYDSLESVFRLLAPHPSLWINLDLKEEGQVLAAETLAERCGMSGRYLFTGADITDAEFAYVKSRGLTLWYNSQLLTEKDFANHPLRLVEEKGFSVLNTSYGNVTDTMLAETPGRLSIWTVKDEARMRKYLQVGVRNITTRMPTLALKLRREIQGK